MSLQIGQIVRMSDVLWRVEYVNECRARVLPLTKRWVFNEDGSEQATALGAVNISPNSILPIVTDFTRSKAELELELAERELTRVRSQAETPSEIPRR